MFPLSIRYQRHSAVKFTQYNFSQSFKFNNNNCNFFSLKKKRKKQRKKNRLTSNSKSQRHWRTGN